MDNQRFPIFLALAFVLFLIFQAWQEDYGTSVDNVPSPGSTLVSPGEDVVSADADIPAKPADSVDVSRSTVQIPQAQDTPVGYTLKTGKRVRIHTDLFDAEIDTIGGDIRHLALIAYPVSLDEPDTPFPLLTDKHGKVFVAQTGIIGNTDLPNHHSLFEAVLDSYTFAEGKESFDVPLTWESPNGFLIKKIFTFTKNSYVIKIRYQISNPSDSPISARIYGQFQRSPATDDESPKFIYTYTGAVLHSEENRYDKQDFDSISSSPVNRSENGGWVAMIQHYFGAAWLPSQTTINHFFTKAVEGPRYIAGVITPAQIINVGGNNELELSLYVGPKEQARLEQAAPGLELLVDYGILTIVAQPIYWLMDFIHSYFSNWGWSIIILTILIKLVFFHLSATSYKSMARMRVLQPRMLQIKERYGDDKSRMNQAMMELYKKEKVNPLGGCLPILVQIPVFIALYWVLLESVELRQADFIFWIKDLSVYDPYFVLPLAMGATMFLQQRLNPAPMDPIQQKVMMMLPIVFTVMFLYFPSGLVLYWFVNNSLSIAQQWVITKHIVDQSSK